MRFHLSDDLLIQAYYDSIKLNLSYEFIKLLEEELKARKVSVAFKKLDTYKIKNL